MSEYNIYQYGQPTGIRIDEDGYIFDHSVYTGKKIDEDGCFLDHSVYTGKRIDEDGYIFDHSLYTGKKINEDGCVLEDGVYKGTRIDEGWKAGAKKGAVTGAIAGAAIGAFPVGALVVILIIIGSLCCSWEIIGCSSFDIEGETFWYLIFPLSTMCLFSVLVRVTHCNTILYKGGSKRDIILIKALTNCLILNTIWIIEIWSGVNTYGVIVSLVELPCLYFAFSSGLLLGMLPYTLISALIENAFIDRTKKPRGLVPASLILVAAIVCGCFKAYNVLYGVAV